jgi:hypothetical protein
MIYRPWGWKYGLFATGGGILALFLVLAAGMLGKEQRRIL